jgi:hypothetical protein
MLYPVELRAQNPSFTYSHKCVAAMQFTSGKRGALNPELIWVKCLAASTFRNPNVAMSFATFGATNLRIFNGARAIYREDAPGRGPLGAPGEMAATYNPSERNLLPQNTHELYY